MRIHLLSDLHLERAAFEPPEVDADVIVLAGDVARGDAGIAWAKELPAGRPVLYVAGNHEFYGYALSDLLGQLRQSAAGTSVHFLENDAVVIAGTRFLGCTLWSDFDFDGEERRAGSMSLAGRIVNDFRHIRHEADGRQLTPQDARSRHLESRDWLAQQLAEPFDGQTVVITHHAPVIRGRPDRALLRAVAGAFASDLSDLMGSDHVDLWIYGHTHRAAALNVNGTRIISNPRGYPAQPVAGFDPGLIVEL